MLKRSNRAGFSPESLPSPSGGRRRKATAPTPRLGAAAIGLLALAGIAFLRPSSVGAAETGFDLKAHYAKSEHMVPMRDGVHLMTIVYSPKKQDQDYPILLFRTPYSIVPYGPDEYRSTLGPSAQFAKEGYIFAYQDVRGQFQSEGQFEVMKPVYSMLGGLGGTDESTDTYDTVEWLLGHIPNHNGKVGQWGISYPGWQTVMGMINAHPALQASSPQASPADMFIGDDFHHNGAFRFMYTFHWLAFNAAARSGPSGKRSEPVFGYGTPDGYQFFLDVGPVANVNRLFFKGRVPTWNQYLEHGVYDEYWALQNVLRYLQNIQHPILNVAGWFDAEDFFGPMSIYQTIERETPGNQSTLVVGPWRHGGWGADGGDSLGDIRFGSKTSEYYQANVEYPFFQHHLKGGPAPKLPGGAGVRDRRQPVEIVRSLATAGSERPESVPPGEWEAVFLAAARRCVRGRL